jgi:hypothetical protein
MKKLCVGCLVLAVAMTFGFGNAYAEVPSSKGSAAISNATLIEATAKTNSWDPVLSTIIQVAQDKELVFDVALQCGLYTDTLVRSKGGDKDTSTAMASIDVRVKLQRLNNDGTLGEPFFAHPDQVTYARRAQTLMAKFQGIFQQCEEWAEVPDPYNGGMREECVSYSIGTCLDVTPVYGTDEEGNSIIIDYITTVDVECLDYEEVQLILDTLNANAFNFVSPNLQQGEYKVTVEAEISTSSNWANGGATAKGLIGLGSMVVDEVRFIKGDNGSGM